MTMERRDSVIACASQALVPADGYSVVQWSPDDDHACGPTQVHLLLPLLDGEAVLVLRMQSKRAIQELVDTLIEHRDEVWPPD